MVDFDELYAAFNERRADDVLMPMADDVHWPNGWEGGYVDGKPAVRAYWHRQWQEIDPRVTPTRVTTRPDGRAEVRVHQVVRSRAGDLLVDGEIVHVYAFDADGRITRMDIEEAAQSSQAAAP